jgi:hypothetical protein
MALVVVRPLRGHEGSFLLLLAIVAATGLTALTTGGRAGPAAVGGWSIPADARAQSSPVARVLAAGTSSFYIAGSAHGAGVGGANWRTDLEVHNPASTQAAYSIALLKHGEDNGSPVTHGYTLAPGLSVRYNDVLDQVFHFSGSAALRITATSGTILVSSRTYDNQPGGSYGQFVPDYSEDEAIAYGEQGRLIQLTQSTSDTTGYRTNIGFVNGGTGVIALVVDLYRSNGTRLGTVSQTLRAYEYVQITKIFTKVTSAAVEDGYAVVQTATPAGKFYTYASVVDNRSQDPILIPAARMEGTTPPPPTPTTPPTATANLVPRTPPGWSYPVVPDYQQGTHTTNLLSAYMNTYVDWAVLNEGPADITSAINFELRIDGSAYHRWTSSSGLRAGYSAYIEDFQIPYQTLSPGYHTLAIVADYDGRISETREDDNTFSHQWEWTSIVFSPPVGTAGLTPEAGGPGWSSSPAPVQVRLFPPASP